MTWEHAMAGLTLLTMFGAMAWLITHARTETIYKPIAMFTFFLGFPAVYMTLALATGSPRPSMLFNTPDEGIVLGYKPDTGKDLYLLLDLMDNSHPVYYRMPWDSETAEQIDTALREGKGTAKLKFKKRKIKPGDFDFDWPWDIPEAEVYVEPTERKMPEKDPGNPMAGIKLAPGSGND